MLMRHISIPLLMLMLVQKFMFHQQRRIYHMPSPQTLHMWQVCICSISTEWLSIHSPGLRGKEDRHKYANGQEEALAPGTLASRQKLTYED